MERCCENTKQPAASDEQRCVVHDVPDDLLRLILLRLDSPRWLIRAACACKQWRRIVAGSDGGRGFLRLARSLHPPVVVGHYNNYLHGGHLFVPSSPTHIRLPSLDFFTWEIAGKWPAHQTIDRWQVADCHGGLVLLREGNEGTVSYLVVCDPLSRRYRNIHHPPNQTTPRPPIGGPRVFLLDGGDDDGTISLSNFRVLYCSYSYSSEVFKVYYFCGTAREWRFVRQSSTTETLNNDKLFCSYISNGRVIGRIDRDLYLASMDGSVRVLHNANARYELSEVELPTRVKKTGLDYSVFAILHSAGTEPTALPAMVFIVHVCRQNLELFRQIPSSGEWVLEHSIPCLSEATHGLQGHPEPSRWWSVDVNAVGSRLAMLRVNLSCAPSWFFSFDVDTMQLQVVPAPDVASYSALTKDSKVYMLPWPQFLTQQ